MKYLFGSQAMLCRGFDVKPKDWDIIDTEVYGFKSEKKNGEIFESCGIDFLNNREICKNYSRPMSGGGSKVRIINETGLAIIKRSHLHRPLNFAKHIRDYHLLKEKIGGFSIFDKQVIKRRTELTKKEFGDKVPSLNMSNEDFFDDNVDKIYVHDDIHKVVAHYDEPLYERMKSDKSKAKCDKDLWNEFSFEDKIKCVQEECFVIGLERKIIPYLKKGRNFPAKMAFMYALERVACNLTSGWFRDFAVENFPALQSYDNDFVKKFKEAKESGALKCVR